MLSLLRRVPDFCLLCQGSRAPRRRRYGDPDHNAELSFVKGSWGTHRSMQRSASQSPPSALFQRFLKHEKHRCISDFISFETFTDWLWAKPDKTRFPPNPCSSPLVLSCTNLSYSSSMFAQLCSSCSFALQEIGSCQPLALSWDVMHCQSTPRNLTARASSNLLCNSPISWCSLLVLPSTDAMNWLISFSWQILKKKCWSFLGKTVWVLRSGLVRSSCITLSRVLHVWEIPWNCGASHHGFTILSYNGFECELQSKATHECNCQDKPTCRRSFSWQRSLTIGLFLRLGLLVPHQSSSADFHPKLFRVVIRVAPAVRANRSGYKRIISYMFFFNPKWACLISCCGWRRQAAIAPFTFSLRSRGQNAKIL